MATETKADFLRKTTLIDKEDEHFLYDSGIWLDVYGYINCDIKKNGIKNRIKLHHLIMGKPQEGFVVDHINGNTQDNRKQNLRFVSRSINTVNQKARINKVSDLPRGVKLMKRGNCIRYYARCAKKYIGSSSTKEGASVLYVNFIKSKYGISLIDRHLNLCY